MELQATTSWTVSVPPKLPKYVQQFRAKGRDYYYFRFKGERRPLPNDPDSPEFFRAYAGMRQLIATDAKPLPPEAGTVAALIQSYRASPEFAELAAKTRISYEREMGRLAPVLSVQAVDIKRSHIRAMADDLADKPRTRKLFAQVVSLLWNFGARELDLPLDNPAKAMRRVGDAKAYTAWTDAQMATFEASNPPVHLMTAYMVARYTGPRRGDIASLMRSHYDGASIAIAGAKTDTPVVVPVHPRLKAYLDALPPTLYLITDARGAPVPVDRLTKGLRAHLDGIGLNGLHLHGLRHTAGKALAEAGCSAHEIRAVLGHKTLQMVEKYTSKAQQRTLAGSAILKLRTKNGT